MPGVQSGLKCQYNAIGSTREPTGQRLRSLSLTENQYSKGLSSFTDQPIAHLARRCTWQRVCEPDSACSALHERSGRQGAAAL